MHRRRLSFPISVPVYDETHEPFLITIPPGGETWFWPLFETEDEINRFGKVLKTAVLADCFMSATNLFKFMNGVRPDRLKFVLLGAHLSSTNEIQFSEQVPADEFFQHLSDQAEMERRSNSN